MGRVLVAVVLVMLVLAGIGVAVSRYLLYRPAVDVTAGQPVHVVVAQGATTAEIAEILAEMGVIDNALMFRLQTRLDEADSQLRAGEYDLTTGMTYDAVLEALTAGPELRYVDVTIPEGYTAVQIAERMAAETGIAQPELIGLVTDASQFSAERPYLEDVYNNSLEGYLFPATYRVEEGSTARDVVEMMLDAFDAQVATLDLTFSASRGLDLNEVVIIASVLEREARLAEEFPLVSSVIYNRLEIPMRLQLCASVLYTLPEGTTTLTNADLEHDSPYNTYLHDGLPVGPISNPGLRALEAAANPPDTEYLYYVLTGEDGSQTFTETYDEFLRAKEIYHEVYGN